MDRSQFSNETARGRENPLPAHSNSEQGPSRRAEDRKQAGGSQKKAKREDRRILTRPDGVISEIEDTTYAILRKHDK